MQWGKKPMACNKKNTNSPASPARRYETPFVFHYLWWTRTLFSSVSFPHVAGNYALPVVQLPRFAAHWIDNSPIAGHRSQAHRTRAHFDDIITAFNLIVDGPPPWVKRVSRAAAHPYPLVRCPKRKYPRSQVPADCTWWLHLNHIHFNFLLSPQRHAAF